MSVRHLILSPLDQHTCSWCSAHVQLVVQHADDAAALAFMRRLYAGCACANGCRLMMQQVVNPLAGARKA